MPSDASDKSILRQARQRALALLDAITRDENDLHNATGGDALVQGAALCKQAAEETRRLIAELDAELRAGEDSQS